jgi:hypothetical protein
MKSCLSNHQSVCPPLIILNRFVDFHEIWYGSNAIHGEVDAIILNSTASVTLKLFRFKFVGWDLLNCEFGLFMFYGNHGNQVVYCSKFG